MAKLTQAELEAEVLAEWHFIQDGGNPREIHRIERAFLGGTLEELGGL